MRMYSNIEREESPTLLSDIEVFFIGQEDLMDGDVFDEEGWYWWVCFPGCLPDSEPYGPFASEEEAITNMQEVMNE